MRPIPDDRIGSYRVETELGPAGSGILIQARHLVLPRRAIIKIVHSAFAGMEAYVLQTLREAYILEAIAHPGVPIVYESGVLRDRRPWFAFELVAGPTLDELLASGPMPVIEVAGLVRDLADLLAHAHGRGVIHRGLRPDRIVLTPARRFPLCIPDWSEAIAHDAAHVPWTAPGGSRSYLAPEIADQEIDVHGVIGDRADMFALGAIAYRALTGELPFALGEGAAPSAPASELRPDAPLELAALIDSLLAFDRLDRPSASEVCSELDWLFETLPELRSPPASIREALLAAAREPGMDAAGPRAHVGSPLADAGGLADDVVLLDQLRPRRRRWTPDVGHLETAPLERKLAEDDPHEGGITGGGEGLRS